MAAAPAPLPPPARPAAAAAPLDRALAAVGRWQGVAAFLFLAVGAVDQGLHNTRTGMDFAVFMTAARRFLEGAPLYRPEDGHFAFKYLPSAALVWAPLTLLPERLAWTVWNVLSAAGLARLMRHASGARAEASGPLAAAAVLVLLMPFYTHMFFLGQCDAMLLWAVAEAERLAARRPALSGALLAAAAVFKPPFALLAAPALARREWRRLAAAALAGAALMALPALRYGVAGDLAELFAWRRLLAATTPGLLCNDQNYGVFALTCVYLVPPWREPWFTAAVAALAAGSMALVALAAWRIRRRDPSLGDFAAFAGVLWLVAFLSPLGWRTNLVGLAPVLYLALALLRTGPPLARWSAAAALAGLFFVGEIVPFALKPLKPWVVAGRVYGLLGLALTAVALLGTAAALARDASPRRAWPRAGGAPTLPP